MSERRPHRWRARVSKRLAKPFRYTVPVAAMLALAVAAFAEDVVPPIHGHYPPGQTGLRGGATPSVGWSLTDFNRLFSNLEIKDPNGGTAGKSDELRYANIAVLSWTSDYSLFGLNYGAYLGVPFATGNLNPDDDLTESSIGLGDIIVTPVALYGRSTEFDYQFQFSVWAPSGEFKPGGTRNRGSGFWSLIYSFGGAWYPGGDRQDWSISAVARIEQNFDQAHTHIAPGDDFDLDWGIGKIIHVAGHPFDVGISGFGTWQISTQSGGQSVGRYHYNGIGPEVSTAIAAGWAVRVRAQWEYDASNAVQGNNIWFIVNKQF